MTKQQELVRQVTGKNRLSNIMLCCKIVFDLIPQMLLIHMIGLYFTASLTRERIFWECGTMLICFIGKAVCAYSATWTAHKAAYTCLTDLRLQIIRHLKKLSLGFFQERKTGDLTNVVQHDVEQVEGHLAHGLPEIMSATILPAAVFLVESGVVLVMSLGTYLLSVSQIELPRLILAIVLGGLFTSSIAKVATFQHYGIVFKQAMKGIWSILGIAVPNRPEQSADPLGGEIVISNLNFAYNGEGKVLENINLRFPKGSKTALVGASGCGKSTLAGLLMGFWESTDGRITIAGEAGVKFSGGEKQRISIARMILKDAPIIILDEATAAVDTENEAFIQAAIDDLSRDKTVMMIAHHLNTIRGADQIVVMDSGRIVDTGRHNALLDRCALYRKMVEDQNKVDNWKIKEASL